MRIKGNVKMCIFLLLVIFNFFFIILNNVIFIVFLSVIFNVLHAKVCKRDTYQIKICKRDKFFFFFFCILYLIMYTHIRPHLKLSSYVPRWLELALIDRNKILLLFWSLSPNFLGWINSVFHTMQHVRAFTSVFFKRFFL